MENINTQYGVVLEASASELTQGMRSGGKIEQNRMEFWP